MQPDPKQQTPPDPDRILSLLDAPESDDGVLAEARSLGPKGCEVLARAVVGKELDSEHRARAVHLMGLLRCPEVRKLANKLLRSDAFGVRVAALYALVATDAGLATEVLLPLIEDQTANSLLREHAVRALWPDLPEKERRRIGKALRGGDDERLRLELESLLLQLGTDREDDVEFPLRNSNGD